MSTPLDPHRASADALVDAWLGYCAEHDGDVDGMRLRAMIANAFDGFDSSELEQARIREALLHSYIANLEAQLAYTTTTSGSTDEEMR